VSSLKVPLAMHDRSYVEKDDPEKQLTLQFMEQMILIAINEGGWPQEKFEEEGLSYDVVEGSITTPTLKTRCIGYSETLLMF
jgi:hypothetical protein